MKRFLALLSFVCLTSSGSVGVAQAPAARSLVITNARILDGRGGVIERGTVTVRDGKIVSVAPGAGSVAGAPVIDAKGMTVMPGFIESHRHIIRGNPAQWMKEEAAPRMQEYLDAGFTTVLSAGDPLEQILELRKRTETGDVKGPRIIASGRAQLARAGGGGGAAGAPAIDPARSDRSRGPRTTAAAIPPEETRATVASLAKAGVDAIKTAIIVTPNGPEKETLSLIVKEAKQLQPPGHHACRHGAGYGRCGGSWRGRARSHAAHRPSRGIARHRPHDCQGRDPNDVNARHLRALLRQ